MNASGETLHYVYLFEARSPSGRKIILPLTYRELNDAIFWDWKGYPTGSTLPLFGLDRLAANPDADVLIVEGEKCAEVAAKLFANDHSIVVVSTMGGREAGPQGRSRTSAWPAIIIWPDNDAAGVKFAKRLADRLIEMDCVVSIVDVAKIIEKYGQGLDPDGLDVADLPLSAELAADVRAFAVPYAGDPLKGLNKADPAAIDAFIGMMKAAPNGPLDIDVLMALAKMPASILSSLLDRLAEAGVAEDGDQRAEGQSESCARQDQGAAAHRSGDVDPTKMLLIDRTNPNETAAASYEFVVKGGEVFHSVVEDRMVRLSSGPNGTVTIALNSDGLKIVIHNVCRPYEFSKDEGGMVVQMDCEIPTAS